MRLRVACTGAVLVAIAACAALGEMSRPTEWVAMALVSLGMVFSYRHPGPSAGVGQGRGGPGRRRVTLIWFFTQVSSRPVTDITTVENPLTVLFVCILVVHSFHVPSRRDLLFSLGASAGLMAVGAAQAIDLHFGVYAVAWVGFVLWALDRVLGIGQPRRADVRGGSGHRPGRGDADRRGRSSCCCRRRPWLSGSISWIVAGSGGTVPVPGGLAGDAGKPTELSRPAARPGPPGSGATSDSPTVWIPPCAAS